MKKTLILGTACALFLGLGAVGASAHGGKGGQRGPDFAMLDADGDGQVTLAELEAHRAARFAEMDADGDGFVTEAELTAHAEAMADERRAGRIGRMMSRMDADDDGRLSIEELQGRRDPALLIERLDSDGDGALSPEEMADMRQMRGGHGGRDGHGGRKMHRD
ncbi:EF-hand domain-containing protein [Aestuariicoccus sp. MJ-SS9]|uniref:EF-hand domain-containing protein n=1 Tax=Aestuariicoccus sp. MJ-SS9 TaxID=3079855 RepID=UPI00290FAA3C|nr:EF-hand domain-containing protein [Aestuariicoccus sp. MJ-SS9]MDU8909967.1 EF-hand domain-containing protein [Aestuariicoccus sp. MJ-SS9]